VFTSYLKKIGKGGKNLLIQNICDNSLVSWKAFGRIKIQWKRSYIYLKKLIKLIWLNPNPSKEDIVWRGQIKVKKGQTTQRGKSISLKFLQYLFEHWFRFFNLDSKYFWLASILQHFVHSFSLSLSHTYVNTPAHTFLFTHSTKHRIHNTPVA